MKKFDAGGSRQTHDNTSSDPGIIGTRPDPKQEPGAPTLDLLNEAGLPGEPRPGTLMRFGNYINWQILCIRLIQSPLNISAKTQKQVPGIQKVSELFIGSIFSSFVR